MTVDKDVLDWEDLPPEDQRRAEELLKELSDLFDRNFQKKEEITCEDSTSDD
jgi:hypothetical protein